MYISFLYESLGTQITIIAFFMAFAWTVGFVMDVIIGHISDKLVTRFGRRRPLMILGAMFYPALIILLFTPPEFSSKNAYQIWLGVFFIAFFIAYSIR